MGDPFDVSIFDKNKNEPWGASSYPPGELLCGKGGS
jgi:hypothetical protein